MPGRSIFEVCSRLWFMVEFCSGSWGIRLGFDSKGFEGLGVLVLVPLVPSVLIVREVSLIIALVFSDL